MKGKKINILAFAAHPDDVEACAGGLLIKAKKKGFSTGIIDMTRGEASNFGSVKERDREAKKAAKILSLDYRFNLNIPDEHVLVTEENILKVVSLIRDLKPDIILAPYYNDLHPDHAHTGQIVNYASFFAKIKKYSKDLEEKNTHQVSLLLFYMLHTEFQPSFILDVSEEYQQKIKSVYVHRSQFFKKEKKGYTKQFHNPHFMEFFESRAKVYGYKIGVKFGEPYLIKGYLGLTDFTNIISGELRSLTSWIKNYK